MRVNLHALYGVIGLLGEAVDAEQRRADALEQEVVALRARLAELEGQEPAGEPDA